MSNLLKELFKKVESETGVLYATQTGRVIPIEEFPDEVIKTKMLGDGVGIEPTDGKVYAPADGVVMAVTPTFHAYCIRTEDKADILIHIGVDTVELNGQGFHNKVKEGVKVKKGDLLCEVDLNLLKEKGLISHTAILFTDMSHIQSFSPYRGEVSGGASKIMDYRVMEGK